jgi:hypothetical protein
MPETLLTRGGETAQSIGTGVTRNTPVNTVGYSTLVVQAELTGAATGDLGVTVQPYEADNASIAPHAIPPVQSVGPTLSAGKVYYYGQWDVQALEQVNIALKNNNAGTQTINRWSWRLQ